MENKMIEEMEQKLDKYGTWVVGNLDELMIPLLREAEHRGLSKDEAKKLIIRIFYEISQVNKNSNGK